MQIEDTTIVIGLPVYNGENFLEQAIASILSQSFTDFQLLISDNASTDATEAICRHYLKQDSRIKYHRHPNNTGAVPNFNFVFQPGKAPYFKWAAHDDILEPDYLRQCIDILERDPTLVIAHCPAFEIDASGRKTKTYDDVNLTLNAVNPSERFWRLIWTDHFSEIFGVMRSQTIADTKLYGSYVGSDRNFFAEILLRGNIGYGKERLFCRREHPESYIAAFDNNVERLEWLDPLAKYPEFLTGLIKIKEYANAIASAPISFNEKLSCWRMLSEFLVRRSTEVALGKNNLYRDKILKQKNSSALPKSNL